MHIDRLDGHIFGADQPCFGCGPKHPFGMHLTYEREGDAVKTTFVPKETYQGPPGIMHGGLVSTVADETAAWAIIASQGKFGFTTSFSCKLHKPVRIGVETQARGWLTRTSSRIVKTEVSISQNNEICYTGEFTFVLLDQASAEKLLGQKLPEAWARFSR